MSYERPTLKIRVALDVDANTIGMDCYAVAAKMLRNQPVDIHKGEA
jgi:hypothetical protein